jgi:hypothetical protein
VENRVTSKAQDESHHAVQKKVSDGVRRDACAGSAHHFASGLVYKEIGQPIEMKQISVFGLARFEKNAAIGQRPSHGWPNGLTCGRYSIRSTQPQACFWLRRS